MNYCLRFLQFIQSRGVSEANQADNKMTGLLNIISFLSFLGAFAVFLFALLFTKDYVYTSVSFGVAITYLMMVVLHHFNCIEEAKLYFSAIIPLWYVTTMLCIGGNFSQSIATVTTIVIAYLLYKEEVKLRNGLILYNILLYIISTLYVTLHEPIFGVHDYPIDEIVVFTLSLGWISIVFSIYETKTEDFIASLQAKNIQLEQKTEELERFTYIASHDLKSPLGNITNFLNLMSMEIKRGKYDKLEEFLGFAKTGADQMKELIEGVLEFSKLEQKEEVELVSIDLNNTLTKALKNIQQEIEEKNAILTINPLPSFCCNEAHFVIIFQNLIQNGLKYNTSAIPEIIIYSEQNDQEIKLYFRDNGIGIAQEHYSQIFEFFKRLHTKKEYVGTGLGLGLCKKIVEKYNGKIAVESEVGVYTLFSITLPHSNVQKTCKGENKEKKQWENQLLASKQEQAITRFKKNEVLTIE